MHSVIVRTLSINVLKAERGARTINHQGLRFRGVEAESDAQCGAGGVERTNCISVQQIGPEMGENARLLAIKDDFVNGSHLPVSFFVLSKR